MHKKALECMKKTMEEFCMISDPTCEQAELFKMVMCGYGEFINGEYKANIIDEMKEAKEEEKLMGKMGMSDRIGYIRSPRVMGYNPYLGMDEDGYMGEYIKNPSEFKRNMRMGYIPSGRTVDEYGRMNGNAGDGTGAWTNGSGRGDTYYDYRKSRRNYTETHSAEDKRKMEEHAKRNAHESLDTFRELWRDGDAEFRQYLKTEINKFVADEMK